MIRRRRLLLGSTAAVHGKAIGPLLMAYRGQLYAAKDLAVDDCRTAVYHLGVAAELAGMIGAHLFSTGRQWKADVQHEALAAEIDKAKAEFGETKRAVEAACPRRDRDDEASPPADPRRDARLALASLRRFVRSQREVTFTVAPPHWEFCDRWGNTWGRQLPGGEIVPDRQPDFEQCGPALQAALALVASAERSEGCLPGAPRFWRNRAKRIFDEVTVRCAARDPAVSRRGVAVGPGPLEIEGVRVRRRRRCR